MKVYIQGIIFGILSVISGLMMSGIPLGSEMIEIANLFILVIGVFAVFFVGVFKKKYNVAAIVSAIYLGALFSLTMIIDTNMSGFAIAGIGFVPGLSLAVTGLITSIQQKGNRKIRSVFLNAVNGVAVIMKKGLNSPFFISVFPHACHVLLTFRW